MSDVSKTLQERHQTHGDYHEQAEFSQTLQDIIRTGANWRRLTKVQKDALTMMMVKVSRILTGNPNHADSWHDVAGFATLAERDILNYRTEKTDGTDHGILGPVVPEPGPVLWRPGDIISK